MGAKSKPASVPAQAESLLHYHVVFNDGPAQDHWTTDLEYKALDWQEWWNSKPRNAGKIATIRECSLSEDLCEAYRTFLACTSCVGRRA